MSLTIAIPQEWYQITEVVIPHACVLTAMANAHRVPMSIYHVG